MFISEISEIFISEIIEIFISEGQQFEFSIARLNNKLEQIVVTDLTLPTYEI